MIENLKDLKEFFALCREFAVTEIEFGGCKVKLGPAPIVEPVTMPETKSEVDRFIDGSITQDELVYWSAGNAEQAGET